MQTIKNAKSTINIGKSTADGATKPPQPSLSSDGGGGAGAALGGVVVTIFLNAFASILSITAIVFILIGY